MFTRIVLTIPLHIPLNDNESWNAYHAMRRSSPACLPGRLRRIERALLDSSIVSYPMGSGAEDDMSEERK